ncbi:MAG TPA: choice-of-anchor tandem repeat GloVer-containing protein [Alphaproteobacteria bacterium]|nr:choice-of-anchor tandem repeat GloVer-containing protein [Alphaproteobacteria bacterium]
MKLFKTTILAALLTAFTLTSRAQAYGPALALSLNGTNGYATVTNAALFNFTNAFTVEAWVNVSALNIEWQAILTKGDSCWRLHRYNYSDVACFSTSGLSNVDLAGVTPIDDGNWHHIAGVYDGAGNKYLYVDGSLDAYTNVAGTLSSNSYPLDIGENAQQSGRVWDGEIDEVRIWDVALSQSRIQADMHRSLVGNEPGLVAYYRLDDGGPTITNSTGNSAEDGVLVGEAAWVQSTAPIGTPIVGNLAATKISANPITLNGTIVPNFQQTGYYFQYGTTSSFGYTTPVSVIDADADTNNTPMLISQTIAGLTPGTVYYYQLVATNSAGTGVGLVGSFTAPLFTSLYNFSSNNNPPNYTNSDGAIPQGGLVLSGNTLYGTAAYGGAGGYGTVFAINTDGTCFTNLHSFSQGYGDANGFFTNSDGAYPYYGNLTLSGGTLYGAASEGGPLGGGTVFALGVNGLGFTNLYDFSEFNRNTGTNVTGDEPEGGLLLLGNTLYGTAVFSGPFASGTVFSLDTNGLFTNLFNFNSGYAGDGDGKLPTGGLILSGHTLYGTTDEGGSNDNGTVFAINTDGTGITNLYSFSALSDNHEGYYYFGTNSDGDEPPAGLVLSGNELYGTTSVGGDFGNGTIFRINTDGTGFTNLYSFSQGNYNGPYTNSDGAVPEDSLIVSGTTLYGTAEFGGAFGFGTVFAIHTDGSGFTNLYNFTGGNDGGYPIGGLVLSGNTLYGTAEDGGANGEGTVFALTLPTGFLTTAGIPLSIQPGNHFVVLSWTDPAFSLQAAPAPNGPYTNVPGASSPYTNTMSGAAEFFRLKN